MTKQDAYTTPSMIKVTELSDDFLKRAHKIMRDRGYKLDSGVQSASITWTYKHPDGSEVYMLGWHGRDSRKWGAGKVVHEIHIVGSKTNYMESDFKIFDVMDMEMDARRRNFLPDFKLETYSKKLNDAIKFLEDIDGYVVTVKLAQ